jgi:DNA polymerase-3 subunit alpha
LRTVESLIKAGAFDSLGHPRKGLCLVFEQIVDRTLARRREEELGVMNLFADLAPAGDEPAVPIFDDARVPIPDSEFDKMQRLAFEKEMLGLYVSDHPLLGAESALRRHVDTTIAEMRASLDLPVAGPAGSPAAPTFGSDVRWVGGVITSLVRKYTKKGELMATFTLEDLEAAIEVWVFPRTMIEVAHLLADDAVVCVKGRLDQRDDQPKLICMELKRPQLVLDGGPPVRINLPLAALTDGLVDQLKVLLVNHPGSSPVFLHLGDKILRLPETFNVEAGNGLIAELRVLLGSNGLAS